MRLLHGDRPRSPEANGGEAPPANGVAVVRRGGGEVVDPQPDAEDPSLARVLELRHHDPTAVVVVAPELTGEPQHEAGAEDAMNQRAPGPHVGLGRERPDLGGELQVAVGEHVAREAGRFDETGEVDPAVAGKLEGPIFLPGEDGRRLVVVSVLDNLLKGAATQAVQNLNLAFGLPEASGIPLFPKA